MPIPDVPYKECKSCGVSKRNTYYQYGRTEICIACRRKGTDPPSGIECSICGVYKHHTSYMSGGTECLKCRNAERRALEYLQGKSTLDGVVEARSYETEVSKSTGAPPTPPLYNSLPRVILPKRHLTGKVAVACSAPLTPRNNETSSPVASSVPVMVLPFN